MNRNAVLLVVLALLSSTAIPMSVSAEGSESRDPPTVKIGFLVPLTGPIAVYGPGFSAAGDIAENHINAMQSQYNFEIVVADSACDGSTASSAAHSLAAAGVVAVAGAACSGGSMGANSVLSTYGIPQVSYASTNPMLSDDSSYPGFMRVVPSDGQEGYALSHMLNQTNDSYPALIHMDNSYGNGVADSFTDAYGSSNICSTISYDATTHSDDDDFSDEVYSLFGDGCDSVVLVSYNIDGAALVHELRDWTFGGSIIGGSGITYVDWPDDFEYPNDVNGVQATRYSQSTNTNLGTTFENECNADSDCSSGIYTAEAYDSIRVIAEAYVNSSLYSSLEQAILGTGTNWEGASGYVTFLPNGDAVGNGWDLCEWASQSLSCTGLWTPEPADSDGDGWTDVDELDCSTDPNDSNSVPYDSDSDGMCNHVDADDDNDGFSDTDEAINCGEGNDPLNPVDSPTDTDGDQICDGLDDDDDNDGIPDECMQLDTNSNGQGDYPNTHAIATPGRGCEIDYDRDLDDDRYRPIDQDYDLVWDWMDPDMGALPREQIDNPAGLPAVDTSNLPYDWDNDGILNEDDPYMMATSDQVEGWNCPSLSNPNPQNPDLSLIHI